MSRGALLVVFLTLTLAACLDAAPWSRALETIARDRRGGVDPSLVGNSFRHSLHMPMFHKRMTDKRGYDESEQYDQQDNNSQLLNLIKRYLDQQMYDN